ncbi:MAG: hypothetical protein RR185_09790, partial [Angelakisella sp.]
LTKLLGKNKNFKKARPLGAIMAMYSAVIAVGKLAGVDFSGALFTALNLISVGIWIYLTYLIVLGVKDLEINTGTVLGFHQLLIIWKIQAVLQVMVRGFLFTQNQTMANVSVLLTAILLALNVVFLAYFYRAKTMYALVSDESYVKTEEIAEPQKPISKVKIIIVALIALAVLTAFLWSKGVFYVIDRQTSPNGKITTTVYSRDVSDAFPTNTGITFEDRGEFKGTHVYENTEYVDMWWSPCSNYIVKSLICDGEPYLILDSFIKNSSSNLGAYINMNLSPREKFSELMTEQEHWDTLVFDFVDWQDHEGNMTVSFSFTDFIGKKQNGTLDYNV